MVIRAVGHNHSMGNASDRRDVENESILTIWTLSNGGCALLNRVEDFAQSAANKTASIQLFSDED